MSDGAAWRGRLNSRWRKLRRDPAAFADDLPSPVLRALAVAGLVVWTAASARRRTGEEGLVLSRSADGSDYEIVDGRGRAPSRWPEHLSVTAPEGALVLAASAAGGRLLAATEARPDRPGMLNLAGQAATIRAYRVAGGGPAPDRLDARAAARWDILRGARRQGAGWGGSLREAWPPAERRPAEPSRAAYDHWIQRNEPSRAGLEALSQGIDQMPVRPVISVLMPVHDPRPAHLQAAIASLRDQVYPDWRLCVADDGSVSQEVRAILVGLADDPRVRLTRQETARGVAAATNAALALADGDVVLFLDHDDLLAPHALALIAWAFARDPELAAVYSDEDTVDADGRRSAPLFKPDFDGERLLAQNYVNHAFAVRADLLRRLGGLGEGIDGAQDHDLVLRIAEATHGRIGHIPAILYHWRVYPGGGTLSQRQAGAATGRQAVVRAALERRGETATVEVGPGGYARIERPAPDASVLAIVPTRDRPGLLEACVSGLLRQTDWPALRVRIVDNGSETAEARAGLDRLAQHPRVEVLRIEAPFNFSALNNAAARGADADLLAFINDDILVVDPDWLGRMAALAVRPDVGAVGAMLHYPDGRLQHAGLVLGLGPQRIAGHEFRGQPADTPGPQRRLLVTREVSAVTAACMVVERAKIEAVGGFDESFAVAFNDVDLCLRLRAKGWRNLWTPFARLIHVESATRGSDADPARTARFQNEVERMRARWGATLLSDPYYNPNLTIEDESFTLAHTTRWTRTQ